MTQSVKNLGGYCSVNHPMVGSAGVSPAQPGNRWLKER